MKRLYKIVITLCILFFTLMCSTTNGEINPVANSGKKIAVLSALPQEQKHLHDILQDKEQISPDLLRGKLEGHTIYSTLSGIGKVSAAATTQKLISEHQVDMLFFSGVAGGINPNLKIGDLIVADRAFQHDYGFYGSSLKVHPVGTMPELGFSDEGRSLYFDLKQNWPEGLYERFTDSLKEINLTSIERNDSPYTPKIYSGYVVATGDQFVANAALKTTIANLKGDVVEMEGAAVAQVAVQNNIPLLIIRSVSDEASGSATVDFPTFLEKVVENNARVLMEMISLIPSE